ncbi:MAG TPA: carbohydrate ABC transporter permease [bacterium]|nr:carbohydrate ABC transporter permease [bacterium]
MQKTVGKVAAFGGVCFFTVLFWIPLLWIILSSVKRPLDVTSYPPALIFRPSFENYIALFTTDQAGAALVTSLVASLGGMIASMVLGTLAGYGLAKLSAQVGRQIGFYFLSTRFAPPIALALPLFLLLGKIHLVGSLDALIVVYSLFNLPLVVWLMRQFFRDLPGEIEEAAVVDGCSDAGVFWYVALPLVAPGLVATSVLAFLFAWNEFFYALILGGGNITTLPVLASTFATDRLIQWGELSAICVVAGVPIAFFATLFQRYLLRGLTFGAVK